jgi:ligand-binding sensor domain-containing protein/signal transduction histidine kinase
VVKSSADAAATHEKHRHTRRGAQFSLGRIKLAYLEAVTSGFGKIFHAEERPRMLGAMSGLKKQWLVFAWLCLWLMSGGSRLDAAELPGSPFTVQSWSNEEGLPQSSVISVIQTQDGYLWLGTLKGLVRFDGTHFTVFNEFNTPGLNSDQIVLLFQDSHTNLWVGTDSGEVARIHDGKVENIDLGGVGQDSRLISACEDTNGAVWLYTADARLARYRNGSREVMRLFDTPAISRTMTVDKSDSLWISEYEPSPTGGTARLLSFRAENFHPPALPIEQEIQASRLDYVLASRTGGIWRLMDGRVQKWNGNVQDLGPYPWTNATATVAEVTAACEDAEGNLIVGTPGNGVYWFDARGNYRHIAREQGLSSDYVLSLCVDQEGDLWVGTDGDGLNRVKRKTFISPEGLAALRFAQSIAGDNPGGLWTAFNAHGAVYWRSNSVQHYGVGLGQNAWTVLVDHQQQVWLGSRGEGLFSLQSGEFQPAPGADLLGLQIFALFEDRDGKLWAGTQNGLAAYDGQFWKVYTTRDGLPENAIRAIAQDAAGNLWIGTESQGLCCFKDGKFTSFPVGEKGPPGNNISALFVDRDDTLWVGTSGLGLACFKNGKWRYFTTDKGRLASNSISYIIEDDEGNLWIGSNRGLMRIPKTNGILNWDALRTFGRADGLPTRECSIGSEPAACRTADGKLWFPTVQGVVSVNPARIKPDEEPPLVYIESVLVGKQEQNTNSLSPAWSQAVVMPAGVEQLEIHYTGLHFTAPQDVRFRYQLEGHETTYNEVGNERVARYNNLWPGHYVFHVMAGNEDGVWNETGSSLEITVLPEFWQTRTFFAAVVVVILAMVAGIVRYISTQKLKREVALFKQHEELEKERSRIARDLHDQLGANLTQVALLGEMAKADRDLPEEVESHAEQILQTARETTHALDEIVWAVNPSNDTLEGLVNYAVKYAQEYLALANLRYRADVPAQLPASSIPPEVRHNVFLAFKEAVNNVVKHAQASEVRIRLEVSPQRFTFEIADNGRGLAHLDPNRAKTRNGLRNMRKRLEEIHGEFSMTPGAEGGTIVRLTAPLGKSGQ